MTIEDWEGQGQPIIEGTTLVSSGPTKNTLADTVIIQTGSEAQFDDITSGIVIDPALGATFAARLKAGSTGVSVGAVFGPTVVPIIQPTFKLTFRSEGLGLIDPASGGTIGSTSQGFTAILQQNPGIRIMQISFIEGAIMVHQAPGTSADFWFLDSAGNLTKTPANIDKTRWVVGTSYLFEVRWVTNTTFDIYLNNVQQNASPISVITNADADIYEVFNLRGSFDVRIGDFEFDTPFVAPSAGGGDPFQ